MSLIKANSAERGGAIDIYTLDSFIILTGHQRFVGNSAKLGGAISLLGNSKLIIESPQYINFANNQAESNGEAIFITDHISKKNVAKLIIEDILMTQPS